MITGGPAFPLPGAIAIEFFALIVKQDLGGWKR
jgi:hypothetical protein